MDLIRQAGESLAGRVAYIALGPFHALEVEPAQIETLWVRRDFIRTYLERDVPQFGRRIAAEMTGAAW